MRFLGRVALIACAFAATSFAAWFGLEYWAHGANPFGGAGERPGASRSPGLNAGRELSLITAPAPGFVVERELPDPEKAEIETGAGPRVLLVDLQHEANGRMPAVYNRYAMEAVTHASIGMASQYTVPFNPAYQTLEINHARIMRDGVTEDRLDRIHADFMRREELLTQGVMTGAVTALIRFDDVRIGDVVDVGFTIYGTVPGLKSRDSRILPLGFQTPVEQFSLRSEWPGDVRWSVLGYSPAIARREERGKTVIEAKPQRLDVVEQDLFLPPWLNQGQIVVMSDFANWKSVAEWARPYYRIDPGPDVTAKAKSIVAEHDTLEARIMAALKFVAQDVRYFAMALGEGGYKPVSAEETLETRVGDCKAKTLLLLSLLNAMGIEGTPALASLSIGHGLDAYPPTPLAFDHMIARVDLDGQQYWLDPTATFQGERLETVVQPDYGYVLPLDAGSDALVKMPAFDNSEPSSVLIETFDLSDGLDEPVSLDVEMIYAGLWAENFRQRLTVSSEDDLQTAFLSYYKSAYGEVETIADLALSDDPGANTITLKLSMRLPDPYRVDEDRALSNFDFGLHNISQIVPDTGDENRETPVALVYPVHDRHVIHLIGPPDDEEGPDYDIERQYKNAAFRFRTWMTAKDNQVTYGANMQSLTNALAAEELKQALADQTKVAEIIDGRTIESLWNPAGKAPDFTDEADISMPQVSVNIAE